MMMLRKSEKFNVRIIIADDDVPHHVAGREERRSSASINGER
jgi:hypothetical protein